MLVVNRSPYSYYLKNQEYPVPAGASLEVDNALWASDDELARVIESLDRWNIVSVSGTLPDNYPRTSAFPEVVNIIGAAEEPTEHQLLFDTTIVGNDNIKSLPTTPVELVAAPGAGKAIIPLMAILSFKRVSQGYGNFSAGGLLGFRWSHANSPTANQLIGVYESIGGISTLLDSGESEIAVLGINATPVGGAIELGVGNEVEVAWALADNSALQLTVVGNSGDFTGGNASNFLTVSVFYTIIELG